MDIDRRLLGGARGSVALVVALGIAGALLLVAQAWLLAVVIAAAFDDARVAGGPLLALLGVVLARAAVAFGAEAAAGRTSLRVKTRLRGALLARLVRDRASTPIDAAATGAETALATGGLDALDAYVSRYLPQRVLAVVVPLVVLVALLVRDPVSAAIVAVTLPLVPLFMALVGASTHEWTERQVRALHQLSGHFLDAVEGLCTLKVFGRAKAQIAIVGDVTDRYRRSLLRTLRLSFLSALVLELLATLSVALVAVAVGLRALGGSLDLQTALFALVLAPEAYLPLRELGASYHAGADGAAVARRVFHVLDRPVPVAGTRRDVPDAGELVVDELSVAYPGRLALDGVSLRVASGEVVAVTGPSGCGKSTLLGVILGLVAPSGGGVRYGGIDLAELDPDAWRAGIAWVPQRPYLLAGSVADNVRLAREDATPAEIRAALALAGLATVPLELPLGEGGTGLSAGERRRIALARAFVRDAPLLLLDEPTAGLDRDTERAVLAAMRRLAEGRTMIVVAHRPALVEFADREIVLPDCARAGLRAAA